MKILLLAPQPFFQNRGTPIAVRMLAEVLAAEGHRLHLLAYPEGEDVEIPGVFLDRICSFPGTSGIGPGFSGKKMIADHLMLCKALRLVRKGDFDLVHAVEESVFIAVVLKKLYSVPFVYDMDSCLSMQMQEKFPFLRPAARLMSAFENGAIRRSAGVIAVCRSLEEIARQRDPEKLVLRLEDVSLLRQDMEVVEDIRRQTGVAGPIFMYVGNLEPYQGIDLLLESFVWLKKVQQEAALVVIGGKDADISRYGEMAATLGIGGAVHFLGPRPVGDLACYLRQADVLVSPRIKGNNTPMKIYSYLDSGRPLVATRLPAHTQVLDDKIARLAEPVPEKFAEAMMELGIDRALREKIAAQAGARVKEEFTRAAFQRKLIGFYKRLEEMLSRA
ncbi:MAG: glycosyltransferase family 4 protein [Deltaproteobacteria bacterium]|nr:glycosyltransferase family 4 protein [Deltaproteobacteria bacterium]